MLKTTCILALLIAILLPQIVEARLYSNSIGIPTFRRDSSWTFIDRLHLDPGHMSLNSQITLNIPNIKQGASYLLQIVAIPESVWPKSLEVKCNENNLNPQQLKTKHHKEIAFDFQLDSSNSYATRVVSKLEVPQQESYSFVLRDCSRALANDGYGRDSKIDIRLDIRNNDSHISASQDHYGWLLPLLIFAGSGMLLYLYKEKQQEGDNWIKLTVKISLWIGVASILFKYFGYLIYAYGSGVQHGVFDVFYLLLHATSDSIVLVLIMLLSYGWTVTFKNARDFDLYVPLASMLGLVNIIMTMLNKISDGQHDKYHMYDSIPAYIMIGFRLVGFIVFLIGIIKSWVDLHKSKNEQKVRRYLYHLTAIGFIYMTFVPIGFIAIRYVSNRYKKEATFFTMQLTRFALNIWLALLAGWKKSVYRSIVDGSFMEKAQKFY